MLIQSRAALRGENRITTWEKIRYEVNGEATAYLQERNSALLLSDVAAAALRLVRVLMQGERGCDANWDCWVDSRVDRLEEY